jgi:hypothetical protein
MIAPEITVLRLRLRRNGFHPIPVEGKRPPLPGWPDKFDTNENEIRLWAKSWHFAHNTGVLGKFTPGLDIDVKVPDAADVLEALAREHFEEHGDILVRFGLSPKRLIPLRTDEPFEHLSRMLIAPNGVEQLIEFRGDRQQWVAFGTHPDSENAYRWHGGDLATTKRENLPYVRREDAEKFLDAAVRLLVEQFGFVLKEDKEPNGGDPHEAGINPQAPSDLITAALAVIPNTASWKSWNSVGMAVWRATGGSEAGLAAFHMWSKKSPKYNARTTTAKWAEYSKYPPTRIGAGTIIHLARQTDPYWGRPWRRKGNGGAQT